VNRLVFRNLRDEGDYPLLMEINHSSHQADGTNEKITLEEIANVLSQMDGLSQQEGVIIAFLGNLPIGYSRLGWYSSSSLSRLYYQVSFLCQEYRSNDLWSEIVANNEQILRNFSVDHPYVPERYFQAWASDKQKDWIKTLESNSYQVVRRYHNMVYPIGEIPVKTIPVGLEIRPVEPEQMRTVWDAQKEMNAGLFENVAEDWLDEKFPEWLANPENNPRCWQLAWAGDQLAGMVLAHFDEDDNLKHQRKHGYTEHIYVRPLWRGRGLASALICHSLQALKKYRITDAELGVDSENESAAYRLYERLGYKTISVDTWFRKPMDYK
jgi:mycothiol synthase